MKEIHVHSFIKKQSSFVAAQHSLEAAYAAMRKIIVAQDSAEGKPEEYLLKAINQRFINARRRCRREKRRATKTFEEKVRMLKRKEEKTGCPLKA